MNKPNLKAIAGADHMVSPEADKHDFDGWYRTRINELLEYAAKLENDVAYLAKAVTLLQKGDPNC